MNPALLVLNPRLIPDCIDAIQALNIPTCWLSYMPELGAAHHANEQIENTDFSHYVVLSDDTIPTPEALDLVLEAATATMYTCVTGYCNLDTDLYADIVNLTTNPLPPLPAKSTSYHFMSRAQVDQHHEATIPTTFAGLALTCLSRDLWLQHPLEPYIDTGGQMDYILSRNLAKAGVPIVAAVGAYVHHVKERWNYPDQNPEKRLLIGERKPAVTWTRVRATA
jgi:hypothetical protein